MANCRFTDFALLIAVALLLIIAAIAPRRAVALVAAPYFRGLVCLLIGMFWCGDVVKLWCFYRNEINLGRGNIVVRYRIIDALSPKRSTKIRLFVSLIASIKLFCDFTVPFSSLTWCMRVMYLWRGFSFFLRIIVLLVFGFFTQFGRELNLLHYAVH